MYTFIGISISDNGSAGSVSRDIDFWAPAFFEDPQLVKRIVDINGRNNKQLMYFMRMD
jgi:hypothetical protein